MISMSFEWGVKLLNVLTIFEECFSVLALLGQGLTSAKEAENLRHCVVSLLLFKDFMYLFICQKKRERA